MTTQEIEQLTNAIEHKAGMLSLGIRQGKLERNETTDELLELVEDAKRNGTTTTEAKLLLDDLNLALSEM